MNLPIDELFKTPANPNLRGHHFKLRHPLARSARRKFEFPVRFAEPWNKLPPEVVDAVSAEIYKLRLDDDWDTLWVP